MARYNTITPVSTVTAASTIPTPQAGVFTSFTGAAPYTVILADPGLYRGLAQNFYNATNGTVTLSTPGGSIKGPGFTTAGTQTMPQHATYTITSDGTDYIITNNEGGPQLATSFTVSGTFTAQSTISMSPASANITMSPTGTGNVVMSPATAGTIDNMSIGVTTNAAGRFTTLTSTSTTSLAGFTSSAASQVNSTLGCNGVVSFTSGTASSTTGNGTLVVTGGVGVSGQVTCGTLSATTVNETSSITLKENLNPITNALDSILQLSAFTYDRKDGSSKSEAGLIAEEVFPVLPNLVTLDEEGNPSGIKYTKLTAYLIEAVKELTKEIQELKGKH
jgi:hypothetical protein